MAIEQASIQGANQSLSRTDYFTQLAFLRLGDILQEIATSICIRSQDGEGGNIEDHTERVK
jgi:hypothetical protein